MNPLDLYPAHPGRGAYHHRRYRCPDAVQNRHGVQHRIEIHNSMSSLVRKIW